MHSSAHGKAQRQRGVLRRGKCVQRALRGVVTRLRTRRTLVATAALVLLVWVLLALCHARLLSRRRAHRDGADDNATADAVADDSTSHVAASLSDRWLLRPDTQHGGSVRVMLLMVSTRVDAQLCYALASAYFADLPVVVLGYSNKAWFLKLSKPSLYLDAIQRAGLRDRDVVLLLDSDILFSGEDMLPFIDDYIARSPAAPSVLDVRAVRAGTARAPSLYSSERKCNAGQTLGVGNANCSSVCAHVDRRVAAYVARTGVAYDLHNASVQPLRYLNSGVSIHRVWSLRELLRAYVQYVTTHKPRTGKSKQWYSDQSVFALFYNDLRAWEVEHDVLRNSSTAAAATQRGPHGLRAGQLQLEQTGRLAALLHILYSLVYYDDVAWSAGVTRKAGVKHYDKADVEQYMKDLLHYYGGGVRLQQRALTRAGNGTHTVDLTPPLLYVASRLDVAHNNTRPAVLTSPLVWHVAGPVKVHRLHKLMQTLSWYVPMRYNATRWQQGRAQVLASHIELWTAATNTTQHVRYGDACRQRHPFAVAPR